MNKYLLQEVNELINKYKLVATVDPVPAFHSSHSQPDANHSNL